MLIFLLFVCFQISFTAGQENMERYNNCKDVHFDCNDIPNSSISYPFWGNNRPEYCGHPDYKLDCQDGFTQININLTTNRVLSINEENKTIRIANIEFLDDACPSQFTNVTFDSSVFNTSEVSNLNVFYGCPSLLVPVDEFPFRFKCLINTSSTGRDDAYFMPPGFTSSGLLQLLTGCEFNIEVPTAVSALENLTRVRANLSLALVLREGFELGYSSVAVANYTFCSRCLESGGQCGFNSTLNQHTCFCANAGASSQTCSSPDPRRKNIAIVIKGIIIPTVLIGICICTYFSWRRIAKHKGRNKKNSKLLFDADDPSNESSMSNMLGDNPDLKIFNFKELLMATNNFNETTKLGQGGFGLVYKGELPNGQVIAIKRLSKSSGQGIQEFKNEVVVISRLQHKNLVRLLGCCIAREEKILIYEYMPNNSLDTYLFDPTKRRILDWRKRFQIIEGISRGILYLHRDSRLKVIHRDLKPSNVLLDEELNPKISDFGMARIFESNELQANTHRVVGTYGYMSPEYAMEGQFSEKSDVFSFGILVLEIVSGRRNTSFYNHDQCLSLLKYVWLLWNENKIQSIIESELLEKSHFEQEIVRCIHVGLLCVQEFANDRPTISTTLSMLTSEIASLPTPKQPAFTLPNLNSHEHNIFSLNTITVTSVGGR